VLLLLFNFNLHERICLTILVTFSLSTLLYYCVVYSAVQPLKAASVLNKISCQLSQRRQCARPRNMVLGADASMPSNDISIGSAVFAELALVTETDRPYTIPSSAMGRVFAVLAMRPNYCVCSCACVTHSVP